MRRHASTLPLSERPAVAERRQRRIGLHDVKTTWLNAPRKAISPAGLEATFLPGPVSAREARGGIRPRTKNRVTRGQVDAEVRATIARAAGVREGAVRREWTPEDLIASWTLVDVDWALVGNKTGATRLGFVALLKFFELEGRFPRHLGEVPKAAVDYLAHQVAVPTEQIAGYDWSGRQVKRHRGPDPGGDGLPRADRRGRGEAGRLARRGRVPGRARRGAPA